MVQDPTFLSPAVTTGLFVIVVATIVTICAIHTFFPSRGPALLRNLGGLGALLTLAALLFGQGAEFRRGLGAIGQAFLPPSKASPAAPPGRKSRGKPIADGKSSKNPTPQTETGAGALTSDPVADASGPADPGENGNSVIAMPQGSDSGESVSFGRDHDGHFGGLVDQPIRQFGNIRN